MECVFIFYLFFNCKNALFVLLIDKKYDVREREIVKLVSIEQKNK